MIQCNISLLFILAGVVYYIWRKRGRSLVRGGDYELVEVQDEPRNPPDQQVIAEAGGSREEGARGFANPAFSIDDSEEENDLERMPPVQSGVSISMVLPSVPVSPLSPLPHPTVAVVPHTSTPLLARGGFSALNVSPGSPQLSLIHLGAEVHGLSTSNVSPGPPPLSLPHLGAEAHESLEGGPPFMSLGDPHFEEETVVDSTTDNTLTLTEDDSATEPMKLFPRTAAVVDGTADNTLTKGDSATEPMVLRSRDVPKL